MGGLLTLPAFIDTFPELDVLSPIPAVKSRAAQVQGVSISIYEIGCLAGALSTLWCGETYGRRKMIFAGASISESAFKWAVNETDGMEDSDCWCGTAGCVVQLASAHCGTNRYGVWEWIRDCDGEHFVFCTQIGTHTMILGSSLAVRVREA
jgi:MFS family permease